MIGAGRTFAPGPKKRRPANGGTFGGAATGCDVTWCKPLVVELGLAEGGEVDTVYFHFDQKRLTIPIVPIGGVDQLFAAFEFLATPPPRTSFAHPSHRRSHFGRRKWLHRHENFNNRDQPNATHFRNRPNWRFVATQRHVRS